MTKSMAANAYCDCVVIHEKVVARVRRQIPAVERLLTLAELFKVLGDFTRVRIISALLHAEMCVCDIAALLKMNKSAVSHQLRELRLAKLVKHRRAGKVVFYSLDDEHIGDIFQLGLEHISEE